jgi:hypothetical protein
MNLPGPDLLASCETDKCVFEKKGLAGLSHKTGEKPSKLSMWVEEVCCGAIRASLGWNNSLDSIALDKDGSVIRVTYMSNIIQLCTAPYAKSREAETATQNDCEGLTCIDRSTVLLMCKFRATESGFGMTLVLDQTRPSIKLLTGEQMWKYPFAIPDRLF